MTKCVCQFFCASDPPDFLPVNVNITIPSESESGTFFCFSVTIVDDAVLENMEDFTLNVESLSPNLLGVERGGEQAKVYIRDNERKNSSLSVPFQITMQYAHIGIERGAEGGYPPIMGCRASTKI